MNNKLLELREIVLKDLAVLALGVLCAFAQVIDKFTKDEIATFPIRFYKIKTRNYHVRVLVDENPMYPLIFFRPKGLFKSWICMDKRDIPKCIPDDIFDDSCAADRRNHLIKKMMELKAFW